MYITVPKAITATTPDTKKAQIKDWYLANMDKNRQVLMKLAVIMPEDARSSGYELIPVYTTIEYYGLVPIPST